MAAIALLTPIRNGFHLDPSTAEREALAAHFAYLESLVRAGEVIAAGPCEDGSFGLVVFGALDAAAAAARMQADPAVVAGVMRVEVKPWRMSLFGTGTTRDWLRFTQRVHLAAAPTVAWPLLSTTAGLERWLVRRATASRADGTACAPDEPLPAGGRLTLAWPALAQEPSADAATGATETNAIESHEPATTREAAARLRIGWYEDCGSVEFRLEPHAGGATLVLEQRMRPTRDFALVESAHVGCRQGWAFSLANLKAVAEHGIDLRDPRPDHGDLVNV
ncbi:MAG: hypothetical protein RI967_824 [Planctomycetota bacterium]